MSEIETMMSRLKSATTGLHAEAEGRALQKQLAKGTVARGLYAAYLGQVFLVHRTLEAAIRRVSARHPAFAAVIRDYHWREPQLRNDLDALGAVDDVSPVPATTTFIARIEQLAESQPVALLGALYVLEGSTNGGKYIAAALRRAWGATSGDGLSYMDPHGELQRPRWAAFKQDMDGAGFSAAEETLITDTAEATFRAISQISDEVCEPQPVGG